MDVDEEGDSSRKGIHILDLSDEILLVILQNLDSPSLFNLSNTCERFRNLVKEKKLWTHFDFQTEKLTALELLKRMHFLNRETRSFRVRGLTANYPFSSWDNPTITGNMLTMLKDSCPNLETLSVVEGFINFNKINILHFPSSLRRLELNKCEVPKPKMPQMFFHRIDTHMSRLEVLCLEQSYWFETHDLVLFSKMPELRVLNLNGSNSMTHCVPYASIASRYGFKKLEVLDLRNTPVSDSDIQCFNITSTLKELLLECPRNLRDDNQPSSSSSGSTRKRRTSHHSLTRLSKKKKRRGSDTEGSSDRPQESTENDDEDSSSDSCTRTRPVKCLRTGRPASEVISITLSCDQNRAQGAAGGSRSVVTFPFRIDGQQQANGAAGAAGPSRPSVQVVEGDPDVLAAQQQQQQQQSNGAEGPSSSSAAPAAPPSLPPTAGASSSSSSNAAADQNAPPPPPLAPPPMNMPQVEIRQNGQMVRMNPIVIHNNNALGPIIIISGPPPSHRTMRHMRIQVFKKKKKARKRRTAKGGEAGSGAGGGGGGGSNKNGEDSVEGDDENEPEDSDGSDDGSEEDDYEDDDEDGEDGNYRPGFYTPSAMNLISDRGICSFGVSPNNVMPNWIWIRAEAKSPNTSIERLVVRNYRQVTDTSLQHLKTCAPKLVYLDVSGTAVTKEAVEQFRIERPDCTVVADV